MPAGVLKRSHKGRLILLIGLALSGSACAVEAPTVTIRTQSYPRPPYSEASYFVYERDGKVIARTPGEVRARRPLTLHPHPDKGRPDTMRQSFNIHVSYRQLAIFSSDLDNPFNDWTEEAFAVGFSWRPESCSFSADEDGAHQVDVIMDDAFPEPAPGAVRSIEVMLDISSIADLEVASISDSRVMPLRAGRYRVRSEYIPAASVALPRFIFALVPVLTPVR